MSEMNVNQLLAQMRAMSAAAQSPAESGGATASGGADFSALLKQSVEQVSETQKTAGQMAEAFAAGDPKMELTEVMVALQKANVSFAAMTEVRNKLVAAYQEVMSMQV